MNSDTVAHALALLDWRRRIVELYAHVRERPTKKRHVEKVHGRDWHQTRTTLFREHPQSPIPSSERAGYRGPHVYNYTAPQLSPISEAWIR